MSIAGYSGRQLSGRSTAAGSKERAIDMWTALCEQMIRDLEAASAERPAAAYLVGKFLY